MLKGKAEAAGIQDALVRDLHPIFHAQCENRDKERENESEEEAALLRWNRL